MSYLGIFELEFQNNIVMLEISTLEFVSQKSYSKKQNRLYLGPKMPYLGIFRLDIKKPLVIFEISTIKFV